jgi:hypothetical protein
MKPDENQIAVKELKEIEDAHYHWMSTGKLSTKAGEQWETVKEDSSKKEPLSGF